MEEEDIEAVVAKYESKMKEISTKLEGMAPNMRAVDKLQSVRARLQEAEKEHDAGVQKSLEADTKFNAIKKERYVCVLIIAGMCMCEHF